MTKEFIEKMANDLKIPYAVYGNFYFEGTGDDDVDVLIKKENHEILKKYLKERSIAFHQRKYYPDQIFITGTEIKVHVTDDLYIGGRMVQYLIKLGLTKKILADRINWESIDIINFTHYKTYRLIKSFLNKKKEKKLDEYPPDIKQKGYVQQNPAFVFFKAFFTNFLFIPFRLMNKHLWVRL